MSISVKNVSKQFGKQWALKNVSFEVNQGEVVGFLGPNGAGKSTMMKIITCYQPPTSGEVAVCGCDIRNDSLKLRSKIGYLSEANPLYVDMYVAEFLEFIAGIHKIKDKKRRVAEVIEMTGLTPEMNKKIARFIQLESARDEFRHIHATGSYGWRWMPDLIRDMGVDLNAHPGIEMREYIYNMPELMAAADLVICRAGASTLNEVAASAVPAIIVPSPNVTDNHQEKNARILDRRGAAVVVRESECDGDSLYALARELLSDPDRLKGMRRALQDMAVLDSAERIYAILRELAAR